MSKRLFITVNSSGLGQGLTQAYLSRGWLVYGEQIADVIPRLVNYPSGDFLDIRTMSAD